MNNHEKPYSQFHNATGDVSAAPTPFPTYTAPAEIVEMEKKVLDTKRRARQLAIVEMIVCCLVLVIGIVSTALTGSYDPGLIYTCSLSGSSIWAPILGMIAAGLGLTLLKRDGNLDNKCLLVSHFVMSIIAAVGSGLLIIFTSACLSETRWMLKFIEQDGDNCYYCLPKPVLSALVALEVLILLGALAHLISCIISSAFVCRYWCCCGRNSAVGTTVLYIPNPASGNTGEMQAIAVPSGAKVVLITGNNAQTGRSIITSPSNGKGSLMNNHEEPYTKFNNAPCDISAAPTPWPNKLEATAMEKRIVVTQRRARYLAIVEMIVSCSVLIFGIISTALVFTSDYWMLFMCVLAGTSIWAPILGVIAAGLGLGALKRSGESANKCLLIAHFVMSIIGAIGSGILIVFTSACISSISQMIDSPNNYNCNYCPQKPMLQWLAVLEELILVRALLHLILCVISSALTCRHWCCCGRKSAVAITIIPNPSVGNTAGIQAIAVPPAAKVVPFSGNVIQMVASSSQF